MTPKNIFDLKIKNKLLISLASIAVSIAVFSLIIFYFIKQNQIRSNLQDNIRLLQLKINSISIAESELVLNLNFDADLFRLGKNVYTKQIELSKREIIQKNKEIEEISQDLDLVEIENNLGNFSKQIETYFLNYQELVEYAKNKGNLDFGIKGEMLAAGRLLQTQITDNVDSEIIHEIQYFETKYLSENEQSIFQKWLDALTKLEEKLKINSKDSLTQFLSLADTLIQTKKTKNIEIIHNNYEIYKSLILQFVDLQLKFGIKPDEGLQGKSKIYLKKLVDTMDDINQNVQRINQAYLSEMSLYLIILLVFIISFNILIFYFITKSILNPIYKIAPFISKISKGLLPNDIQYIVNDEFAEMIEHLHILRNHLSNTKTFADHVSNGYLETEINVFSQRSELGGALSKMRNELIKVSKQREQKQKEEEQRNWATHGIAELSEIMRRNFNTVDELGTEILKQLINYLKANQGGLFLYNEENSDDKYLEMIACYAYSRKKFVQKRIKPGEGLVGACAVERKKIYLKKIPKKYIEITSGLGQAVPTSLLIVPLKFEKSLFGVMEIASFSEFKDHEIEFVEKIGETIATTLANVKISTRTSELLRQSKIQSEKLANKEDEMRKKVEEVSELKQLAESKAANLDEYLKAIVRTVPMIEFDMQEQITKVNELFCKLLEYNEIDMEGKFHYFLMESGYSSSIEYQRFWANLKRGNDQHIVFKYITRRGEEKSILGFYSPLKDTKGNTLKVFGILIPENQ